MCLTLFYVKNSINVELFYEKLQNSEISLIGKISFVFNMIAIIVVIVLCIKYCGTSKDDKVDSEEKIKTTIRDEDKMYKKMLQEGCIDGFQLFDVIKQRFCEDAVRVRTDSGYEIKCDDLKLLVTFIDIGRSKHGHGMFSVEAISEFEGSSQEVVTKIFKACIKDEYQQILDPYIGNNKKNEYIHEVLPYGVLIEASGYKDQYDGTHQYGIGLMKP